MKPMAAKIDDYRHLNWAHPLVRDWFVAKFGTATEPQEQGWPHILAGRTTLISAPTGSGKTLTAFLACIDKLVRKAVAGDLKDATSVVYVSPLKALSNDIQKNLDGPLSEIRELAISRGIQMLNIRTAVRTGDTLMKERQQMLRMPPHILVTTPESLFILLTAEKSRKILESVETVIVDEIHAIADDKRGAHLSLSLERLDRLAKTRPNRIGLSATQNPIELVAKFLAGSLKHEPVIVNVGHRRILDLAIEVPGQPLAPVASNDLWDENFDKVTELVGQHRSTLIFVNTRKQAEKVAMNLASRLGEDSVACHHGSLSRQMRLSAERRLKNGEIKVLVATASLELGIDVGFVDLVCQIGSCKTIATGLQRIGRAGHWRGAIPKGRFFPSTRDELVETAALVHAIKKGDLDKLVIPDCPMDILAQQIVAMAAVEEFDEQKLYHDLKGAFPYRNLTIEKFNQIIEMLSEGITARRGRYGAYLMRDQVNGLIRGRRGARLAAITSGGAIPDTNLYSVVAEPEGIAIGTLDEDFATESHRGDIFLLGNTSWRIKSVENKAGKVFVEDAHGASPNVPFWMGESPSRSDALSGHVSEVRVKIDDLTQGIASDFNALSERTPEAEFAIQWLKDECGVDQSGAEQMIEYIVQGRAVLGAVPSTKVIVAERFFDESGGMQLILHAPFGGRINRAWGMALRKIFSRNFNFDLQAAATEEGLNISLTDQQSFPLSDVFYYLTRDGLRHLLEQAALQSPVFGTRWKWDATRALALLRFMGGKKVPPYLQRLRSEDLLNAVFPGATTALDGRNEDIEIPEHPLVAEVMKDVLTEALDLEGLENVLSGIFAGEIKCVAAETTAPSQFAAEILNANPYAFLDDAPLEERRARAVEMRRILPNALVKEIGLLDPNALKSVVEENWPDIRNADELHDLLQTAVAMPEESKFLIQSPRKAWTELFNQLLDSRRAVKMIAGADTYWVSTERVESAKLIWSEARFESTVPFIASAVVERAQAVKTLLLGWMGILGPILVDDLVQLLNLAERDVEVGLLQLESEGVVLRGQFSGRIQTSTDVGGKALLSGNQYEWCERRILARIHKLTITTLRKQIEPVSAAAYMRWLVGWHHLAPGTQLVGERGVLEVIKQLQGYEIPANGWEQQVLAKRIKNYDPGMLDNLCLKGSIGWGRLSLHPALAGKGSSADLENAVAKVASFLKQSSDHDLISFSEAAERRRSPKAQAVEAPLEADRERETGKVGTPSESETQNSEIEIVYPTKGNIRRVIPTSIAPLCFYVRDDADWMTVFHKSATDADLSGLSTAALTVETYLRQRGASFFTDIVRGTRFLKCEVETALWELVTAGLVSSDSFDNLRSLIDPKRRAGLGLGRSIGAQDSIGRWSLLYAEPSVPRVKAIESMCRVLLNRYGVVFRDVVKRESNLPPWRELLVMFRTMEDRGEIRGGRFVAGFLGEQFALPAALESLRAARNRAPETVNSINSIHASAIDPLNLVGVILPGDKVPAVSGKYFRLSV
jgi:ATP-dependent Lhr-like helicase